MNLTRILFAFTFYLSVANQVFSQNTGVIRGVLYDTLNRTSIPGVIVKIKGSAKSSSSNSKGAFNFQGLGSGQYLIEVSNAHYDYRLDTVSLKDGDTVDMGRLPLNRVKASYKVDAGGRTPKRNELKKGTETELIQEQKNGDKVMNGVTAQTMKTLPASDAGAVAATVPGVTLIEGRFLMLRGLSQRYNSVQINGINAPSTEIDRRAFSFDLIPSSMLDKLAIYKSPTSDIAGDFAGGVIQITTKHEVEKDYVSYGISTGFRLNTSLTRQEYNSAGSTTDFFGFDNGNRNLPGSFPTSLADMNTSQLIASGKLLRNNFSLNNIITPLDFGLNFGFGKNIRFNSKKFPKMLLFTTNNFGYSTNFQYTNVARNRYQHQQDSFIQMFDYRDANLNVESKFNVMSNWIFRLDNKTSLTFKNLYNQIGENETTIRTGTNTADRPFDEFKNYAFHYTSRSIYMGQFEGNHILNPLGDKLSCTAGLNVLARNEPDYRRLRTYRQRNSNSEYSLIDPPQASLFDAARFYSQLNETSGAGAVNYENHMRLSRDSSRDFVFRTGAYAEDKSREFSARWMSYSYTGNPANKNDLLKSPIDRIFSPQNLNPNGGFRLQEGTNGSDHYTATNQTISSYINASLPFGKINFNVGVRMEYFNQQLHSTEATGKPVNVKLDSLNFLPSINMAYKFSDKNQLRLAYGKTTNRPEFRELAPFLYYDFMYDVNVIGNPNLKQSYIDNLDLRFENYPSIRETMSFGVFYKRFFRPIESYVQQAGGAQQYYMNNAKSAYSYGAELEIKRSLQKVTQNAFLRKLSCNINASYIISQVDLGADSTLSQARKRALQGQSPYIVNLGLMYKHDSIGLTVNLTYNVFGKRIAYVGNSIFPNIYEMPRHAVDITILKELNKRWNMKLVISDILNYKYQLWQDANNDGKISYHDPKNDQPIMVYRKGPLFNIGFSYKLSSMPKPAR